MIISVAPLRGRAAGLAAPLSRVGADYDVAFVIAVRLLRIAFDFVKVFRPLEVVDSKCGMHLPVGVVMLLCRVSIIGVHESTSSRTSWQALARTKQTHPSPPSAV